MSYRDETTISFEGASLWMLAGGNGAGKSTVFDAMRWTLFNQHRGGAQGHEALIHHGAQRLRVAFDLEIGAGRFRLLRTLARKGRSTWQIEKYEGAAWQKVPETDMRDGYNRWLREHIGLSDETFCAAFYLAQGRGDAILSARPEERYQMLTEIVDLSAFQRLHERARATASERDSAARAARAAFQNAPGASDEEAAALSVAWDEIVAALAARDEEIAALSRLEPWAQQWQKWTQERAQTEAELRQARELGRDAAQLEAQCARLTQLEARLPPLQKWLREGERAAQGALATERLQRASAAARVAATRAQTEREAALTGQHELETARRQHENARLHALQTEAQLAPQLAQIEQWDDARAACAELETRLAAFPADLEAQRADLEARLETATRQSAAHATLTRFARAREQWQKARAASEAAQSHLTRRQEAAPALAARRLERQAQRQQLGAALTHAGEAWAAARARHEAAQRAQRDFAQVKDAPNCHFCGQVLTPQHAARETERLQNALDQAQTATLAAQTAAQNAQSALDQAQIVLDAAQTEEQENRSATQSAAQSLDSARRELASAATRAGEALDELPSSFFARLARAHGNGAANDVATPHCEPLEIFPQDGEAVSSDASGSFSFFAPAETDAPELQAARLEAALQSDFPRPADLEALQNAAASLGEWKKKLPFLTQQTRACDALVAQNEAAQQRLAALAARFDATQIGPLRAASAAQQSALRDATRALGEGESALETARARCLQTERAARDAAQESARLERELAAARAAQDERTRARLAARDAADAQLQPYLGREESQLRAEVARWEGELSALQRAAVRERAAQWEESRARTAQLAFEAKRLDESLDGVPAAARRAPRELEAELARLAQQSHQQRAQERAARLELDAMERRLAEKTRLESELLGAETGARQHKILAELLGPQGLQRYLLREAEVGIVDEANAVLDRISSGTLRLELRASDDEIAGARKGEPKVLDVAVWHAADAPNGPAMLPAFLSGSQRFRVAVALALGIGRYATRGAGSGRLDAVIIDEGFGSLDKIGRGEMIDELKALGDELRRVILVSHQEEFAEAFPNRYLIEHDGTTSTARLLAD